MYVIDINHYVFIYLINWNGMLGYNTCVRVTGTTMYDYVWLEVIPLQLLMVSCKLYRYTIIYIPWYVLMIQITDVDLSVRITLRITNDNLTGR